MENPVATFVINGKTVKAELFPKEAPNTVANFISLANSGFYDGLIFHRVIDGFMIQGGDPTGTGMGGPGYAIKGEFLRNGVENGLKHTAGTLSMARANNPNSAGSQFFIMVGKADHLDGLYAAFGQVTEGMEAVYAVAKTPVDQNDRPKSDCRMESVRVETFGVEYPAPKKL
jgi:peptidyl-prolyl cis-trans isomerase B (cyclophilin B)